MTPEQRNRLILVGATLLVLCTCTVLAGTAGVLYTLGRFGYAPDIGSQGASADSESAQAGADTGAVDPNPPFPIHSLQPTESERDTSERLAETTIPMRDLAELAVRLGGATEPVQRAAPETRQELALHTPLSFWVQDVRSTRFFSPTATLAYVTDHAYWWVEEGYHIREGDLRQSALRFENGTYPTNRRVFGSEWRPGVDGDPHIYIFLGDIPGVGGYFSGPDEYPPQVSPYSNAHEMFYINLGNAGPGSDYFDGILAHEFQHMIHWKVDRNEETWVKEGLSELAAQLNGYDVGGSDWLFSQTPDTQLNAWPELEDSGPHYGASYLFLSYFLERYGQEAIHQLVAEQADGITGFESVLAEVDPEGRSFVDLFADWVVANYLDDPGLASGQFGYENLMLLQPEVVQKHRQYPAVELDYVHQFAADYVLLEGRGDLTVEFTGSLSVPLIGNLVHSGDYQWWSNRGDEGDATLTRAFDLTGLNRATLRAWMWYDLEPDYDYAYVEVSPDGGETWELVENEYMTTDDPMGSSYGPALNGTSGRRRGPAWMLHTFNLSDYAGSQVLVRFEVITDDSVNRAGLALDDIAIPELGYFDDVEGGTDGWEARGWARVTDQVPQQWLVQVITMGREVRVQQLALDEQMHGEIAISGLGRELERAALVIAGTTPVTTELATYAYRITRQ